jgi:hypothetical protein
MPALVAGIHVFFLPYRKQDGDGRVKPGHGEGNGSNMRKLHVNPGFPALTPADVTTM